MTDSLVEDDSPTLVIDAPKVLGWRKEYDALAAQIAVLIEKHRALGDLLEAARVLGIGEYTREDFEIEVRFEKTIRAMLNTPPKPRSKKRG